MGLAAAAEHHSKRDDLRVLYGLATDSDVFAFRTHLRSSLEDEVSQARVPTAIMSGEHCSSRLVTTEEIEVLKEILGGVFDDITIVLYLRRQDEFLASTYSTDVKSGSAARFELPGEEQIRERYDYQVLVERWVRSFGTGRIICRRYGKGFLKCENIIDDFFDAIKVLEPERLTNLKRPPRVNESLGAEACEFLRLFNTCIPRLTRDGINPLRGKIERLLSEVSPGPGIGLTDETAEIFMARFREGNAYIAAQFFGGQFEPPGDPLFGPAEGGRRVTAQPDISTEQAMKIFGMLWEKKQQEVIDGELKIRQLKERLKK